MFQIDSDSSCCIESLDPISKYISQVNIIGDNSSSKLLTDIYTREFKLELGDYLQWQLHISQSESENIDNEEFDYISSGIIYRIDLENKCMEFSSGGLLSRINLPSSDSKQLESFLGQYTTLHLRRHNNVRKKRKGFNIL